MGAWGTGPLDNDAARDFLFTVRDGGGMDAVEDAFNNVLDAGEEDLEAPTAEEAVAAAAIVARLKEGVPLAKEAELESWITQDQPAVSPELAAKARAALERVMTAPSELRDLWEETDDFPDFESGVNDLLRRLG